MRLSKNSFLVGVEPATSSVESPLGSSNMLKFRVSDGGHISSRAQCREKAPTPEN